MILGPTGSADAVPFAPRSERPTVQSASRSRETGPVGFSIIELMVVVVVVAVLLAVLLPALAGATASAKMAVSSANLRQIGTVFELYESGERAYPVPTLDEFGDTRRYPHACDGIMIGVPRWQAIRSWPALLHDYAPWSEFEGVLLSPSADRETSACGWPTSYYYSSNFLARPETWSENTEPSDALLDSVSSSHVSFPGSKAMLWDTELPFLSGTLPLNGPDIARVVPMLFADGHASYRAPADATEPARNIFAPGLVDNARLHNTRDGVRGIDYR